jgi:23S rRNA pseudouridine955/2504/2580 synthase
MTTRTSAAPAPGVQHVQVGPERDGQRIDNALSTLLKGVPRSLIYRLLRTGQVRVNGKRAKPDTRLNAGDELRLPPLRQSAPTVGVAPDAGQIERLRAAVVHRDKHFLVLDKPSGIASHGGSGISHGVIELLRAAFPDDSIELAHRLDRDTSGVLVLARSRSALLGVQAAIREGRVTKQYLCLMTGRLQRARFDVNAPLRKFDLAGGERLVRVADDGKPALTFFRERERYADASLVEATLATGRTHQIRVHAQHVGHALAGDEKYGTREANKLWRARGLRRLFLHAARFEFEIDGQSWSFSAPLPDDLRAVAQAQPPQPR